MHPSSEASSTPATPNYPSLSNSLLTNEVANVVWNWRHGQVSNYDAMKRVEKSVRDYREDLYV